MAVFNGKLWATPLYHRGVFSYDPLKSGDGWQYEGDPGVRLFALAAFEGKLYAAGNQGWTHKDMPRRTKREVYNEPDGEFLLTGVSTGEKSNGPLFLRHFIRRDEHRSS